MFLGALHNTLHSPIHALAYTTYIPSHRYCILSCRNCLTCLFHITSDRKCHTDYITSHSDCNFANIMSYRNCYTTSNTSYSDCNTNHITYKCHDKAYYVYIYVSFLLIFVFVIFIYLMVFFSNVFCTIIYISHC